MPFKKGENHYQKLGARKPYALEMKQLAEMRKIVDKDIELLKKVLKGNSNEEDIKKLSLIKDRVMIYYNKLHATKESHNDTLELRMPKPILNGLSKNNSSRQNSKSN